MSVVYRIVFQDQIRTLLKEFVELHKTDSRKDFQDAWEEWCEFYQDDIEEELVYQMTKGAQLTPNQLLRKLYTSARYYYCKKAKAQMSLTSSKSSKSSTSTPVGSVGPVEPVMRRAHSDGEVHRIPRRKTGQMETSASPIPKYIRIDPSLLECIKEHCVMDLEYGVGKPSIGYNEFCDEYREMVRAECKRLGHVYGLTKNQFMLKLKKTYKNAYHSAKSP